MQLSFARLLQNELKSNVERFSTLAKTRQQPDLLQDRFDVGGKTRYIVIQLVFLRGSLRCLTAALVGFEFQFSRFFEKRE